MEKYLKPMTKHCIKEIYEQLEHSIYKINENIGNYDLGFFTKIKYHQKHIPVLITNINIFKNLSNDNITITMNNKLKLIELGDIRYTNEEYNIAIIEIKENKNYKLNFIEIDENIYQKDFDTYYDKESIYFIQYNNNKDIIVSYGLIYQINDIEINYSSNINSKSKGSFIFNLNNNKIIGIHGFNSYYYHKGINIKYLIKKFIDEIIRRKYENNFKNEINLLIGINHENIKSKVYFLDNYEYKDKNGIIHFHDNLKELNSKNTKLYIEEKEYKYEKYFIPEKEGNYHIKLIFTNKLKDCSYMFAGCGNIINIDFDNFHTKDITNMEYMFYSDD